MKKYAFIIDIGKCENCNNCFLSCKDEHCGNVWPGYSRPQPLHGQRWMNILHKERGHFPLVDVAYLPKPCMHCDQAPCVAAGGGAVYQRQDGIVIIDPDKARGKKELVSSCPYGAIWWNAEEEVAQKCTFCAHLLDGGWQLPRCVQSCPTGALTLFFGPEDELRKRVTEEHLQVLPAAKEGPGRPRCYYKNLYRYNRCFLAGSIAEQVEGAEECVVGARVVLQRGDEVIGEQVSDDFGDFKFDDLQDDHDDYQLVILFGEKEAKRLTVCLSNRHSVGTIRINR